MIAAFPATPVTPAMAATGCSLTAAASNACPRTGVSPLRRFTREAAGLVPAASILVRTIGARGCANFQHEYRDRNIAAMRAVTVDLPFLSPHLRRALVKYCCIATLVTSQPAERRASRKAVRGFLDDWRNDARALDRRRDPQAVDRPRRSLSRSPVAPRRGEPAQPFRRRGVGRVHRELCRALARARRRDARLLRRGHVARRRGAASARRWLCATRRKPRSRSRSRGRATASARALLERTLLAARNRGIKLLHMACLANNSRMVDLAKKFDAELTFDFGSVVGEVEAPHPTPMSMWREIVADGHGFATAMLDVQPKMLRPA